MWNTDRVLYFNKSTISLALQVLIFKKRQQKEMNRLISDTIKSARPFLYGRWRKHVITSSLLNQLRPVKYVSPQAIEAAGTPARPLKMVASVYISPRRLLFTNRGRKENTAFNKSSFNQLRKSGVRPKRCITEHTRMPDPGFYHPCRGSGP